VWEKIKENQRTNRFQKRKAGRPTIGNGGGEPDKGRKGGVKGSALETSKKESPGQKQTNTKGEGKKRNCTYQKLLNQVGG